MADSNAPKPSSSVKLVLLGEAAVGKVLPHLLMHFDFLKQACFCWTTNTAAIVLACPSIREQRLPREQGAYDRRYRKIHLLRRNPFPPAVIPVFVFQ